MLICTSDNLVDLFSLSAKSKEKKERYFVLFIAVSLILFRLWNEPTKTYFPRLEVDSKIALMTTYRCHFSAEKFTFRLYNLLCMVEMMCSRCQHNNRVSNLGDLRFGWTLSQLLHRQHILRPSSWGVPRGPTAVLHVAGICAWMECQKVSTATKHCSYSPTENPRKLTEWNAKEINSDSKTRRPQQQTTEIFMDRRTQDSNFP